MTPNNLKLAKFIMFLAAIYNVIWGTVVSFYPSTLIYSENYSDYLLILIRCIGMLVGVYGIAYYFASLNPSRYWPLILVGLIGKILGPFGSIYYVFLNKLPKEFLIVNVFNDVIWLIPFFWVLIKIFKERSGKSLNVGNAKSLYQSFLKDDFDLMSDGLQKFHSSKKEVTVLGIFKVQRGNNWLSNLIAKLADLPENSESEMAKLSVYPEGNYEMWERTIGMKSIISKQWLEGGFLVEKFKFLKIHLGFSVKNKSLEIFDVFTTIYGIPLPPFFSPSVNAIGTETQEGIYINVDIVFKPIGRIINYSGFVNLQEIVK